MSLACGDSKPMYIAIKNSTDISSPGYQENKHYPDNQNCEWIIEADETKTIQLVVKDGEVENG